MPLLLENVVALQGALNHLNDLEQRLSGVPEEMRELHDQYVEGKGEIERLETEIAEAGAARRGAETEAEDCNVKLRTYQEQVNRVRTQREYSAILHEIDEVKERVRALEDAALEAMGQQEDAEIELGSLRESFEDIDQRYQVELEKWEAAKPGVADEAEIRRDEVAALREQIPRPSQLLFERVRDFNNGQALAVVGLVQRSHGQSMWHCQACNYNVRPQIVVDIRNNGSLIQCDSCKRLLHFGGSSD